MRLSVQPVQRWAVASLITARIAYAINWLNIGALFYLMSPDLGTGVSGLGTVTSSFYLGVGLMQIPGGIFAARWGPKRAVVTGMLVSSLAALGTSICTSLPEVAILRFLVGVGMALVFAPMVVLVTRLLGNRSGVGAGLVNSAFAFGGLLGLFGWILVAAATGWRPSLALGGGFGVISALLVILLVPKDERDNRFKISTIRLKGILKKKALVQLGSGALGSNMGSVLISSFMVFYLQSQLGETGAIAGLVASMIVVLPIITSVWGGRLYDRLRKPRRILVASGIGMVAALVACSISSLLGASLGTFVGGFTVGPASTVAFAAARDLSGVEKEYESLVIGWVNCISLTGSVWPPLVFSYLAGSYGYSVAWLGGSGLSLVFLIPLLFLS
ncbi:MAG TPA: MFS transporter [Candidatus Bathyarchaeia archaeon]|nr:MFS transporter [Candidatus Bathyarchaeia archaeon]